MARTMYGKLFSAGGNEQLVDCPTHTGNASFAYSHAPSPD